MERRHTPRVVFGGPAYMSYIQAGVPDAGQSDLDKEYIAQLEELGRKIAKIEKPLESVQKTIELNTLEDERLQLLLRYKDARNHERLRLAMENASVTEQLGREGRGAAPPRRAASGLAS